MKYKSIPLLVGKDDNAFMYGDLHVAGDIYVNANKGSSSGTKLVPAEPATPEIPVINIELGIINGIMTALVNQILNAGSSLVVTDISTAADNTVHTRLDQTRATYGNYKTIITVGNTQRTMHVDYVNHNDHGGVYTSDGFYVDESNETYITYKLVIEWNRIAAFAALHDYSA